MIHTYNTFKRAKGAIEANYKFLQEHGHSNHEFRFLAHDKDGNLLHSGWLSTDAAYQIIGLTVPDNFYALQMRENINH